VSGEAAAARGDAALLAERDAPSTLWARRSLTVTTVLLCFAVAVAIGLLEFVGGLLLALGLFTRPIAAAVAVFMAVALVVHWPAGYAWNAGGWEMPLFWGLIALALVIRGGGALSLDRALGREV
jgi:uncharacterized membrane protein YphA (DoxX/SURF4 family)